MPRGRKPVDIELRFHKHYTINWLTGCWEWDAPCADGYGRIWWEGRSVYPHRLAYQLYVGPIPDGLHIDHTCHDPAVCLGGPSCPHRGCVNPDHLEPVTHAENTRRGGNAQRRKTHCPQGHPYNEANTYRPPSSPKARACWTCMTARNRQRHLREKMA